MNIGREHLLDSLHDAHAMERTAIDILERQDDRIERYPAMQRRMREHLRTTRRQAEMLEEVIEQFGGDTSMLRDAAGRFMGNMSALMNAAATYEIVKSAIANYTFEQFEIASYRSLVAAAEELGEDHIATVCRQILRQEEEMAEWLHEQIPQVTRQFLERERAEVEAMR